MRTKGEFIALIKEAIEPYIIKDNTIRLITNRFIITGSSPGERGSILTSSSKVDLVILGEWLSPTLNSHSFSFVPMPLIVFELKSRHFSTLKYIRKRDKIASYLWNTRCQCSYLLFSENTLPAEIKLLYKNRHFTDYFYTKEQYTIESVRKLYIEKIHPILARHKAATLSHNNWIREKFNKDKFFPTSLDSL